MNITCLEANVSRAQAARILNRPARLIRRGRLEIIMDFYLPYRLFEVLVRNAGRQSEAVFAIDSTTGHLDLYSFDREVTERGRRVIETDRVAAAVIDEPEALRILREKVRRQEYLKSFFKVQDLDISGRCLAELHLPYWVGVYRRGDRAAIEVIDGLRGTLEGTKLREVVSRWFQSRTGPEAGAVESEK